MRVGDYFVRDIANDFFTILDRFVVEGISAIGSAQDRAATRQDAANVFERELAGFFRPDQAIKAVRDADDFPLVFKDGRLDGGADDGVQAGRIATPRADADAADVRHGEAATAPE